MYRAVATMPSTLFYPLVTWAMLVALIVYWTVVAVYPFPLYFNVVTILEYNTYTWTHTWTHTHTHTYTHTHIHTLIHTHTRTYTHTHIHTHAHTGSLYHQVLWYPLIIIDANLHVK